MRSNTIHAITIKYIVIIAFCVRTTYVFICCHFNIFCHIHYLKKRVSQLYARLVAQRLNLTVAVAVVNARPEGEAVSDRQLGN
jgi:hypothetical protein